MVYYIIERFHTERERDKIMEKINLAYRRPGDAVDGVLLAKTIDLRKSNNGGQYLDITVMDATGEMNAKAWNWQDNMVIPPVGAPIRLKGTITEFNGKLQMRIDRMRQAKDEEITWNDLVPTAPRDPQEMYDEMVACAKSLERQEFSRLALALLVEKKQKLLYWPAAVSFHHAQRGGLLYHTTTMLRAAEALLPIYPYLDRSLLLCGVIAHDLCKMDELGAGDLGIATEYTKEGNLLGHIVQGVAHLSELGKEMEISQETILLIQHMILSHHEIPEYGSPKPPLFPEAQMLHVLDLMDARMFAMREALLTTPRGSFSDRVRALDGRKLYHPDLTD